MIVNDVSLLDNAPIKDMLSRKEVAYSTSYGLTEAGYDIRIKQTIQYIPAGVLAYHILPDGGLERTQYDHDIIYVKDENGITKHLGNFVLASAIEEFEMPRRLVGVVHDKSTWARKGLSVFNTVIEPGWNGFLTLELVFHSKVAVNIHAGSGIAQVLFHQVVNPSSYEGKYQNQPNKPVGAK